VVPKGLNPLQVVEDAELVHEETLEGRNDLYLVRLHLGLGGLALELGLCEG
jgi:hypothetical protein